MTMLMQRLLNHDKSIVIDGTFYKQELRNMVEKEALDLKAAVYYIKITADEGVIRERMTEKRPYSEADFKVYLALKRKFEGMTQDHLVLDSVKCSVDEMMRLALKYLDE
jgi:predicted kinase